VQPAPAKAKNVYAIDLIIAHDDENASFCRELPPLLQKNFEGVTALPYAEQITFTEAIAPRAARYKAVASLGGGDPFRQEFHLPPAVPDALARESATGKNTYLSLCDYQTPRRAGEVVFGFAAFGFDVDCHASADPAADAHAVYARLRELLFDTPEFPAPTMVEHTGRGLLLIIAFKRAPRQVLPLWLRMGEGFARAIRAVLPPCATLDNTYGDTSRVVRVPDSYNTAAGRRAVLLEKGGTVYELPMLRDEYFPELNPANYKSGRVKARPQAAVYFTDQDIKLHVDRHGDLLKLCEMRGYAMDGAREKTLFLYRYWTCFYFGPQAALEAALELNRRFTHPLPEKEVLRATRSAEKAFAQWRDNKYRGYNYRNATLIEFLHITREEQRELTTIICKEEKARRRAEKQQWGNGKRDKKREAEREAREQMIVEYHLAGMSRQQICEKLGCGTHVYQQAITAYREIQTRFIW
jgi:hypothetical protein